jgi:hypothetical protein
MNSGGCGAAEKLNIERIEPARTSKAAVAHAGQVPRCSGQAVPGTASRWWSVKKGNLNSCVNAW